MVSYSMKDRMDRPTSYSIPDNADTYTLDKKINDHGVTFDYRLTFHDHTQEKVNKA